MTDSLELRSPSGNDVVSIVPARGAIITRWLAGGRERLYLDEGTLRDLTKNVRGGIPLLFPSPGKLAEGRFERAGKSGALKQHGFARDSAWTVSAREDSSATLSLEASPTTRAEYPWDFRLTLRVDVADARLRLALRVENRGKDPLPFAFGTHPYFLAHDKTHASITTAATRAFDNVKGEVVPFRGFDLGHGETDLHLLDHGSTESTLGVDGGRVTVQGSAEFVRWVVWTLPGKDFVCVEPWTAPGNALNTGESLITLAPNSGRDLWLKLVAG